MVKTYSSIEGVKIIERSQILLKKLLGDLLKLSGGRTGFPIFLEIRKPFQEILENFEKVSERPSVSFR